MYSCSPRTTAHAMEPTRLVVKLDTSFLMDRPQVVVLLSNRMSAELTLSTGTTPKAAVCVHSCSYSHGCKVTIHWGEKVRVTKPFSSMLRPLCSFWFRQLGPELSNNTEQPFAQLILLWKSENQTNLLSPWERDFNTPRPHWTWSSWNSSK